MHVNLEGKVFRPVSNTENGEVGFNTLFHYCQSGEVVTATYEGEDIATSRQVTVMR